MSLEDRLGYVERELETLRQTYRLNYASGVGFFFGIAARVSRSTNQTLSGVEPVGYTPISFDLVTIDTDGFFSMVAPTQLTCRTPGVYLAAGTVRFAANATGTRLAKIRQNASTDVGYDHRSNLGAAKSTTVVPLALVELVVGDYLELLAWQDSGGDLAVQRFSDYTPLFQIAKVA